MGLGDKIKQVVSGNKNTEDNTGVYANSGDTRYGTTGTTGTTGTAGTTGGYRETGLTTGAATGTGAIGGGELNTDADYDNKHSHHRHNVASNTATTGTGYGTERGLEGEGVHQRGEAAVCGQEYYTKTEDRPIVKERVEYIKEHRPVEKEFVVETRATGQERHIHDQRSHEHLGTQERVVSEAQPRSPCE
jgi:hypothetical protein